MKNMNKKTVFSLLLVAVAVFFLFTDFPSKSKDVYLHREGFVFGTVYSVTYCSPDGKDLSGAIVNALQNVDNSLSMFNRESTIAKINNNEMVELDSLFCAVWRTGEYVSRCTEGAFDMTVAPLVDLWGFGLKNREIVSDAEVDSVSKYVGYEMMVLDGGVMRKAYSEMRIDAGAIAKGFACDVVADTLEAYGCTNFCVEIGGELTVKGLNPKGEKWHIAINKPVEDSLCANREIQKVVELTNCGMATSGNYRNFYELDGKKYSHTIDPRTGYPVRHNLLSATIIASDCMTADAWATACMVAGLEQAKTWITNNPELQGYLIYEENGEVKIWDSEARGYIVEVGDNAPDFELEMDNGGFIKLSDLRGKVVMLQFTASWCGICRKEMPYIESDIWQKYKDNEDFVLVGIDREETPDKVALLRDVTGITYPLAYDTKGEVFCLYAHKNEGITRNVLINREGVIVMLTRKFEEEEFRGLCDKIDEELNK